MTARRRVLITGGEGFIGANLARRLTREGCDLHVMSRPNPTRRFKLLDLLGVDARMHPVDLLDLDDIAAALADIRPHEVFHLAARVDLERSAAMAQLCIDENVVATVNLLEALVRLPAESVVFTSTTEVYGSGPVPFVEDQPVDPPSPYAISKVAAESFCRLWARMFGCPVRIVRLAAAYGPGQPVTRLVPSIILAALRKEPLELRSPEYRRDYLFVDDVVEGLLRAARSPVSPGSLMNLGSPDAIRIRDVAASVLTEMGMSHLPVTYGSGRVNEAPHWATDISRARRDLGWAPAVPLGDGLARTVKWYRGLVERGMLT